MSADEKKSDKELRDLEKRGWPPIPRPLPPPPTAPPPPPTRRQSIELENYDLYHAVYFGIAAAHHQQASARGSRAIARAAVIRNRAVYFLSAPEILDQIDKADLSRYLIDVTTTDTTIHGFVNTSALPMLLAQLRKDERFAEGKLFGLHTDVGAKLTDFRSYRGVLGEGSLQIVIDKETGRFYADCDKFNIYQDLVNVFGHSFGEVVPYFFRSVWSKFRKRKQLLKPIGSGDGNHIGTSE